MMGVVDCIRIDWLYKLRLAIDQPSLQSPNTNPKLLSSPEYREKVREKNEALQHRLLHRRRDRRLLRIIGRCLRIPNVGLLLACAR
jgi:hypothetical protein